jgi:hypothetical protein
VKYYDLLLTSFAGMFLGIYLEAHYPQMFRSWDNSDSTLYRGDKVILHLDAYKAPYNTFYKGCDTWFLASQAVTSDNLAWVLLKNCDFQKDGLAEPIVTDTFRLRDLERIKR